MEVKRESVTQAQWDEMKKIVQENVCGECGGELTIRTKPETGNLEIWCPHHPDHHGYVERETYTQALRRGEPIHPAIQANIERKMMPKEELGRAMQLLALRYPSAIVDPPTAALFIMDCARLDLDPLISPAEAVPVPFKSKKKDKDGKVISEKTAITMIITEDGWLSMAARGCKDEWVGPPRTMRLEEYLAGLPENRKKTHEEILAIAREIKESKCKDPEAWYYVAIGRRRDGEDTVIPGYFTHLEHGKAERGYLPAATQPGNQARVRAIKRWVRETFPECRQKMIELTAEWYQRAEGIKAAQVYIDAEYSFIRLPEGGEKSGGAAGNKEGEEGKTGTTILSTTKAEEPTKIGAAAAEPVFSPGDLLFLNETLKEIKWTEETAKSWLENRFKIDTHGELSEVISRLTREQAEAFSAELQNRLEQKQLDLWK